MKKNSPLRLKLHRETLRTLAGPETGAAQGGSLAACIPTALCQPPTQTCHTLCGGCTAAC